VISYVPQGYVIGVSYSLQIVIDTKPHAVALTRPHDPVVARIPNRSILARSYRSALTADPAHITHRFPPKGAIVKVGK